MAAQTHTTTILYLLLLLLLLLQSFPYATMQNTRFTLQPIITLLVCLFIVATRPVFGFGSMGPIAASTGDSGIFCAIAAGGGNQEVLCWGNHRTKNSSATSSLSSSSSSSSSIPSMFALSGGQGFLCGISSNTSQPFCWSSDSSSSELVPPEFRFTAYSAIAAGESHVCAVRGPYYSAEASGIVDCWEIVYKKNKNNNNNQTLTTLAFSSETQNSPPSEAFKTIVAGDGFTCGDSRERGLICWGPNSNSLKIPISSISSKAMASSKTSLCLITEISGETLCFGDVNPPETNRRYVSLSGGSKHFCGIREDNHGVECWGSFRYNQTSIPKGPGFAAIASSELFTCGIREDDLVLDCWQNGDENSPLEPPLELCSPGICRAKSCGTGEFEFNASVLNEPDLISLCSRKDLKICSPCGTGCSEGLFLSSPCSADSGRVCTSCTLCQSESCREVCRIAAVKSPESWRLRRVAVVASGVGIVSAVVLGCFIAAIVGAKKKNKNKKKGNDEKGGPEKESEVDSEANSGGANSVFPGAAQVFRLSELKDATNGFKEFNELGRGSYGFVYKAVLTDGRQVAVKRANAATIIRSNNRDFDSELEILCRIRHRNIVNLLGYCSEMGERLLVYEYMPHGTLFDHLHGGLSPLNWASRLRASAQMARGIEYLHTEFSPPIVHRDVKSSNVLIDAEWVARVADFGLVAREGAGLEDDIFGLGVILLEVLSGRKAFDRDFDPPGLVEWARPMIEQGRAAAIIDRYLVLPKNVEPLLRLADVAELATRADPKRRPGISEIASSLENIVKDGLIL